MRVGGVWSEPRPSRSKLVPIRSHSLPASCLRLSAHSPTAAIHADGSGQVGAALPSHYISDTSCGDTYVLSEPGLGSPRCSESCREEGAGQAPESQPCWEGVGGKGWWAPPQPALDCGSTHTPERDTLPSLSAPHNLEPFLLWPAWSRRGWVCRPLASGCPPGWHSRHGGAT